MRVSLANIIGVFISMGMLILGVTETIKVTTFIEAVPILNQSAFFNLPSFFIVLGGVLNAAFITYQPKYVGRALFSVLYFFSQSKTNSGVLKRDLGDILEWNDKVKQNRVRALGTLEDENEDNVAGYLFSLLSTNYSNEDIQVFGSNHIEEHFFRHMVVVDVLKAMGGAAPSFGMFGTLFGLVVMLGSLDDPSNMGPGLAAALMTTLYGISLARFIFYPIAEKIKNIAQMNKFREYFILEGIILINEKKSNFYIEDKLSTYLQRDFTNKNGK